MAGTKSKPTLAVERASQNIMSALARAKGNLADIPLGETRFDPRTEKKRAQEQQLEPGMDSSLTRILHEMRNNG